VTNEEHNKYIAYAFFGHAGFQFLMLLFIAAMFGMVFFIPGNPGEPEPPKAFFAFIIAFMTVFQMMFIIPSVLAGYALLKRKSWARIASIIAGVVAAMSVPFGTAACVYALWFFLGDNWKEIYTDKAEQFRGSPREIAYGVVSQRTAYEEEETMKDAFDPYQPPDWR
jgi:hypothetical protein